MNLLAKQDITFEEAIDLTTRFIEQLPRLSEEEKKTIVTSLVMSENGARGFFVVFLTNDNSIVDQESIGIIEALKTSPNIVSELLVKNVAMSTAMSITHHRNNNKEMAEKSKLVTQRSLNLINEIKSEEIKEKSSLLVNTIKEKQGIYQSFLTKWGYDEEQKKHILETFLNNVT